MSTGTHDPDPNTTSSTLVSTKSRGAHVLTVQCYSATKVLVPTGSHLSSASFPAGRYSTWHLTYYPNGDHEENSDHASLFLVLDGTAPKATVVADFTISLLDEAGAPVPGHSKSIRHHKFAGGCGPFDPWCPRAGFPEFVGREDLERSGHLRDDRFSIRCDVVVFECRTVSGLRPRPQEQLVADGEITASLAVPGSPWGGVEWWYDGREDMFSLDELFYGSSPVHSGATQQPAADDACSDSI
ncbi:unnamed protein product [Urochloa humidicola]